MNPEDVLLWVAGVQLPKADTQAVRTAAGHYRRIADAIDASRTAMDKVANDVRTHNSGEGPDGFNRVYFGPPASGGMALTAYPPQVAAYARKIAQSLEDYAKAEDQIRSALWILAIQMWVNIMFTIGYGWLTGFVEARLLALVARARWLAKIRSSLIQMLIKRLLYAVTDSVVYAGGQQALQLGVYGLAVASGTDRTTLTEVAGYDPFSVKENAIQFADGFAGNVVYNGVMDALPGVSETSRYRAAFGKYFLRRPGFAGAMGGLTTRMIGSNGYTYASNVTDSYLRGDGDWTTAPTLNQEAAKLFFHVPRIWVKYPLRWKNWPNVGGQVGGVGTP
jgi:hypothetical protein